MIYSRLFVFYLSLVLEFFLTTRSLFLFDNLLNHHNTFLPQQMTSLKKGKIFVVGTNEVITSAAVTAILCGEGREDDDEHITRDEIDSTPNPVTWSLVTRY